MESYTYEQLKAMKVADLRKIADGIKHEALDGHTTMHKEQLLPALCTALNIPTHHAIAGKAKLAVKAVIHKLKARRDAAIKAGDRAQLTLARRQIHAMKRKLRRLAARSA